MPELLTFVLGDIFGILTLVLGIVIGFWLGRMWSLLTGFLWGRASQKASSGDKSEKPTNYHEQLAGMIEFTNHFTGDLTERIEALESMSEKLEASATSANRSEEDGPSAKAIELLAQITAANQRLKQRLESAEATLKTKAHELETSLSEARTDALTQLLNRRAFDEEQGRRWAYWRRKNTPYSLLILDIDHFKQVNDQYGHDAGDLVLKEVAKRLGSVMRETDYLARIGGEEMAIMIPESDPISIVAVVRKVLDSVRFSPVTCGSQAIRVTISCGVMSANRAESTDQLMKGADEALYASKKAGRNCGYYNDGLSLIPIEQLATGEPCAQPELPYEERTRLEPEAPKEPPMSASALEAAAQELKSRLFQVSQKT